MCPQGNLTGSSGIVPVRNGSRHTWHLLSSLTESRFGKVKWERSPSSSVFCFNGCICAWSSFTSFDALQSAVWMFLGGTVVVPGLSHVDSLAAGGGALVTVIVGWDATGPGAGGI